MSEIQIWYTDNNDMLIEVSDLINSADGSYINDATVLATLQDKLGVDVPGIAWPVTVPYSGTDGLYRVTVDKAAQVLDDTGYDLTVTAASPGGLEAQWQIPVGGETRT